MGTETSNPSDWRDWLLWVAFAVNVSAAAFHLWLARRRLDRTKCPDCNRRAWTTLVRASVRQRQEHARGVDAEQILMAEVLAAGLNPSDFSCSTHSIGVRIDPKPDEGEEWQS